MANTWSVSNTNYGGRIAFDRAGFLFLTVGERQEQDRAQKPEEHAGKVLRLRDDGTVPPDNPVRRASRATCPRSTRWATAARRGWRCIPRPASCGRTSTGRWAATS